MTPSAALLVDDDPGFRRAFQGFLIPFGWEAICAGNGEEGLALLERQRPPLVFLDVMLPGMSGLEVLREIKARRPEVGVVMVSGLQETGTVVQAMKLGAADFLVKPVREAELGRTLAQVRIPPEAADRRDDRHRQTRREGDALVGDSAFSRELSLFMDLVGDTEATILLEGESGVGKGVVARRIHERSSRKARPFVKVNCAALPAELLEAELFGFERGSFTGAVRRKPGKFELAHGGTLLLDEVGELPLQLQAKLLHVLQDSSFSRLGGEVDIHADVRVIAASNRDLEAAVGAGSFRADLYYRLNVVRITIPPLRERREEIPGLARFFHAKYCREYGRTAGELSPSTLETFMSYAWPGNIRELENVVKRIVLLGTEAGLPQGRSSLVESLGPALPTQSGLCLKDAARRAAREAERHLIVEALHRTRWNRAGAARRLGISYKALLYKIRACGLQPNPEPEGTRKTFS